MALREVRIAFLLPGTTLPSWQVNAMRHAMEIPGVRLVVMGIPGLVSSEHLTGGIRGYLEKRALDLLCSKAHLREDASDLLGQTPVVAIGSDGLTPADLAQFNPYEPEMTFSFLPPFAPSSVQNEQPIWQFNIAGRGLLPTGLPVMGSHLLAGPSARTALVGVDGKTGLGLDISLTDQQGARSIDALLYGAAWLPARMIVERVMNIGSTSNEITNSIDDEVSMMQLANLTIRLEIARWQRRNEIEGATGSWNIGILYQPITVLLEEEPSMNVRWLPSPSTGNHRMEPFGYTAEDGQLNVIYRKKSKAKEHDTLARLRPKSDSVLKRSRSMLSTQADLEYPFVVERPDGAYVIVSYPHQGRTELFKVAPTNDQLHHIKILMNRAISSPTLTEHEGRWWLFGTDPDAPDNILLAFHSPDFDGPFQPHTLNPIKVGSVGVRPAGTFFRNGEQLWRPTLDKSETDTMAVILAQVEDLTPTSFREKTGKRVAGFWGSVYGHGVRTLSTMGDITLIDGVRLANRPKSATEPKQPRERRPSSEP